MVLMRLLLTVMVVHLFNVLKVIVFKSFKLLQTIIQIYILILIKWKSALSLLSIAPYHVNVHLLHHLLHHMINFHRLLSNSFSFKFCSDIHLLYCDLSHLCNSQTISLLSDLKQNTHTHITSNIFLLVSHSFVCFSVTIKMQEPFFFSFVHICLFSVLNYCITKQNNGFSYTYDIYIFVILQIIL